MAIMEKISKALSIVLDGRADKMGVSPSMVNQKELRLGIGIEKEHTPDPGIAKKIAMDHLAEIPDYYSRLVKMENDFKMEKKAFIARAYKGSGLKNIFRHIKKSRLARTNMVGGGLSGSLIGASAGASTAAMTEAKPPSIKRKSGESDKSLKRRRAKARHKHSAGEGMRALKYTGAGLLAGGAIGSIVSLRKALKTRLRTVESRRYRNNNRRESTRRFNENYKKSRDEFNRRRDEARQSREEYYKSRAKSSRERESNERQRYRDSHRSRERSSWSGRPFDSGVGEAKDVLGVSSATKKSEIKNAYRNLARKYHPDVSKAPDAMKKMKDINAAHDKVKSSTWFEKLAFADLREFTVCYLRGQA